MAGCELDDGVCSLKIGGVWSGEVTGIEKRGNAVDGGCGFVARFREIAQQIDPQRVNPVIATVRDIGRSFCDREVGDDGLGGMKWPVLSIDEIALVAAGLERIGGGARWGEAVSGLALLPTLATG